MVSSCLFWLILFIIFYNYEINVFTSGDESEVVSSNIPIFNCRRTSCCKLFENKENIFPTYE